MSTGCNVEANQDPGRNVQANQDLFCGAKTIPGIPGGFNAKLIDFGQTVMESKKAKDLGKLTEYGTGDYVDIY